MQQLTAIRVFNRVAELGSFAAAARALNMSATAVSRHVLDLEAHLGARLLNRTTRRLSLTEVGAAYHARSRAILDDLKELDEATGDLYREPSGTLRATSAYSVGEHCVVPLLAAFRAAYPSVAVHLRLDNRLSDLVAEGLDVAIRLHPADAPETPGQHIFDSEMMAVASPDYLDRHGTPAEPAALKDHVCILLPQGRRSGYAWRFARGGEQQVVDVEGDVLINSSPAVHDVACAGAGVAYVPDYVAREGLSDGRLVRLFPGFEGERWTVLAVFPDRRYLTAKVRVFVDFLAERLGSIGAT